MTLFHMRSAPVTADVEAHTTIKQAICYRSLAVSECEWLTNLYDGSRFERKHTSTCIQCYGYLLCVCLNFLPPNACDLIWACSNTRCTHRRPFQSSHLTFSCESIAILLTWRRWHVLPPKMEQTLPPLSEDSVTTRGG